mmetsp:Transcript_18686/g.46388  ORF Transcript_18686/g.46388 Transcript_18686/m.46388 type:complete len:268 (-) Transcript_18686:1137-1940(-)
MDFIVNHPCDFSHEFGTSVEHASENLGGHHQACRRGIDGDISCHQSDISEFFLQIPEFLIAQCLDGRCVDDALSIVQRLCNRIFCDGCLSRRRVGGHQHGLFVFDVAHGLGLKGIQRKGVFLRRLVALFWFRQFHALGQVFGIGTIGSHRLVVGGSRVDFFLGGVLLRLLRLFLLLLVDEYFRFFVSQMGRCGRVHDAVENLCGVGLFRFSGIIFCVHGLVIVIIFVVVDCVYWVLIGLFGFFFLFFFFGIIILAFDHYLFVVLRDR